MGSHRPVDLLPGREAGTFTDWLKAHPGVRVICRDRAGAHASGGRVGAPDAVQVADRFHLWQNPGETVEKTVIAHRADLREPAPEAGEAPVTLPEPAELAAPLPESDGFRDVCGRERRLIARHRERYAAVHARLAEGLPTAPIARDLHPDRHTVDRFAQAASLEEVLVKATSRASILDPFKPYLNQRWNDGCTSAAVLRAELQARGWKGSVQAVRRYLRQFRPAGGAAGQAGNAAPAAPAPPKAPPGDRLDHDPGPTAWTSATPPGSPRSRPTAPG